MGTTHFHSQSGVGPELELDEDRRPVAVNIRLDTGDRVRITTLEDRRG